MDQNRVDFGKVNSEAIWLISQAVADADIDVPDPTYNIWLLRKLNAVKAISSISKRSGKVAIDIFRDDPLGQQVVEDLQYVKNSNLLDPATLKEQKRTSIAQRF